MKLTKLFGLVTSAVAMVFVGCAAADNPFDVFATSAVLERPADDNQPVVPADDNQPVVIEGPRISNMRISGTGDDQWGVLNGTGAEILYGGLPSWRIAFTLGAGKNGTPQEFSAIKDSIAKIEYEIGHKAVLNSSEDWNYFNGGALVGAPLAAKFGYRWEDAAFNSLYTQWVADPGEPVYGWFKHDITVHFKDGTVEKLSKTVFGVEM